MGVRTVCHEVLFTEHEKRLLFHKSLVLQNQNYGELLFLIISARDERKVLGTTADRRIGRTPPRDSRVIVSAIHATCGQTFSMNSFYKDPCYLLRKRSVLGS